MADSARATSERAAAAASQPGRRLRIARTRRFTLEKLGQKEREAFFDQAFAVYSMYKRGVDRAAFEQHFFAGGGARVVVFHGEDGAFAGFSAAMLHRLTVKGRQCAVYSALMFIDTRYKGSREGTLFAVLEALRFKL